MVDCAKSRVHGGRRDDLQRRRRHSFMGLGRTQAADDFSERGRIERLIRVGPGPGWQDAGRHFRLEGATLERHDWFVELKTPAFGPTAKSLLPSAAQARPVHVAWLVSQVATEFVDV